MGFECLLEKSRFVNYTQSNKNKLLRTWVKIKEIKNGFKQGSSLCQPRINSIIPDFIGLERGPGLFGKAGLEVTR